MLWAPSYAILIRSESVERKRLGVQEERTLELLGVAIGVVGRFPFCSEVRHEPPQALGEGLARCNHISLTTREIRKLPNVSEFDGRA